ncbi:MAG: hypothetical protein ABWW66_02000 [Archaeoglobaceae archaeon]
MIVWSYRVINNRVARRKWLLYISAILLLGVVYTIYKIATGTAPLKAAMMLVIFIFFLSLYAVIVLGKPRTYVIEGDEVRYKPFKAKLSKDYEVDRENLVVRFRGRRVLRTLYFEREEDMKEVLRYLERL